MTRAPDTPPAAAAVPKLQRTDYDAAALRRAMATIQRDGWWRGGAGRDGKHCIATAIRHNEGVWRYFKVMHRLKGELGSVRRWNDSRDSGGAVIRRLEGIAKDWEQPS